MSKQAYRELHDVQSHDNGDDDDSGHASHTPRAWQLREGVRRARGQQAAQQQQQQQQQQMARLFLAITLDDATRLQLCGLPLAHIPKKRHIEESDFHITLNFIGVESVDKVHAALNGMRFGFNSLKVRVKGVGAFPSRNKPLTLWAGVEADATLFELQAALKERLRQHGVRVNDKHDAYRPHVTVGWVVKCDGALEAAREFVNSNQLFQGDWFAVQHFVLMQTISSGQPRARRGAYVVRQRYALRA